MYVSNLITGYGGGYLLIEKIRVIQPLLVVLHLCLVENAKGVSNGHLPRLRLELLVDALLPR